MKDRHATLRIALMLKAKGFYGRNIIAGVCDYVKSTRLMWDLLLEEDFRSHPESIRTWLGDGIIADFDDPDLVSLLGAAPLPVVGIGGSYQMNADALRRIPYVASDNAAIVKLAYQHLIDMGLERFAFYSIVPTPRNRWAQEREAVFRTLVEADGLSAEVFNGRPTHALEWGEILDDLVAWLRTLPKPIGIIAVTDSRARQVLQACIQDHLAVPDEVAIIGIDDDPLLRMLSRLPISSVAQGTWQMGQAAASMLHRLLGGAEVPAPRALIPPTGVNAQASSRHCPQSDPYVMRARHYIRLFAAQGAKVEQVAEYVGVSRTTLDNRFRQALGCTVHDEILAFKLGLSRSLLEASTLSCAEIAARSGFASLPYMYAVYRRELGCTPVEYQAQHRQQTLGGAQTAKLTC